MEKVTENKQPKDFDAFYNESFAECSNDSDKMDEMTIEDFKWNCMSKAFDAGVEFANAKNSNAINMHDELMEVLERAYQCSGEKGYLTKPVLDDMLKLIKKAQQK